MPRTRLSRAYGGKVGLGGRNISISYFYKGTGREALQ